MRNIVTLAFILTCVHAYSQSPDVSGKYFFEAGDEKEHLVQYTLNMDPNGSFLFHAYTNHKKGIPWERHKYGKGRWNLDGKVISFFTDKETDLDEQHSLNFSNSKARFISKPRRDQTDRVVETALQFFASEILWIERLKVLKKE